MSDFMTHNPEIVEFFRQLKGARSAALLLDYDGTLAPFAVDRRTALPYPGVQPLLQAISDGGRTRVIVVTGRSATDISPLLQVHPTPEIWGSHGLQRLQSEVPPEMPRISARVTQALANAERWLAYQGLHDRAEPKPGSLAVHWRGLNENSATALREKILLGWSALMRDYPFTILEFDGGVELRLADYDKSRAVQTILQEIEPEIPVAYLGDDRTDEPAFRALQGRGLTVLVRPNARPTLAQVWLKPPEELLAFLAAWLQTLPASPPAPTGSYSSRAYGDHEGSDYPRSSAR